jgi:hypothetical protein
MHWMSNKVMVMTPPAPITIKSKSGNVGCTCPTVADKLSTAEIGSAKTAPKQAGTMHHHVILRLIWVT